MIGLAAILGTALSAGSAPTVVKVEDAGRVRATVFVPMSEKDLRTRLADAAWPMQFDKSGTKLVGRRADGSCELLDYHTSGFLGADWTVRQCPTATGYAATLTESSFFSRYESQWILSPEGTGVRLEYFVDVGLPKMVPSGFARDKMASSVGTMMDGLVAWAEARSASVP
jgi:hypothetical protein